MTTSEIMQRASAEPIIHNIIIGLKTGSRCSVRKSIELGQRFAQNTLQRRFFKFLKNILRNPKNFHGAIIRHAVNRIDYNILKIIALNIGISSMERRNSNTHNAKGKAIAEVSLLNHSNSKSLTDEILMHKKSGAFIFVIGEIQNAQNLLHCVNCAEKFPSCILILKYCTNSISERNIRKIKQCGNIIMAINQANENKKADLLLNLKEYNLLYGYYKNYKYVNNKENIYVLENAQLGCLFGIYTDRTNDCDYPSGKLVKNCALPILLDDYDILKRKWERIFE